ncbi:SigB/SigF/SigG family RNA polymerase sigma factor [Mycobacterium sp. WMMD1722]|uniref:SigB/SigF/SigG family RNA polymerase sigma factor n=1 Tax=Mycobacterium sp. WMMD1722 TaxID=3404117 RepID=UPI003BF50AE4
MTVTLGTQQPTEHRSASDEYGDVAPMISALRELPPDSEDFWSQRERIVERCLPLADHIAYRYSHRGQDVDDLMQVARLGLLNAIARFDPALGSSFAAYAIPTIMGEVRRHFRDQTWAMSVPRRMKDHHVEITRAIPELAQALGRAPTATELGTWLGLSREEVLEGLVAGDVRKVSSLDHAVRPEDNALTLADTLGTEDDRLQAVTDRESLRPLLAALPQRERDILCLRFFESQTQSQIAQRVGLSQMHVSRLLQATLEKLRNQLG